MTNSKTPPACRVLFHVVEAAGDAPDGVRRRNRQETLGHRGRRGELLYQIRHILRAGRDRLTTGQRARLEAAFTSHPAHISVEVDYLCAQDVRGVFRQDTTEQGRRPAHVLINRPPARPIPEIARLGRTLRKWKDMFMAHFDTGGANNGPTEAI